MTDGGASGHGMADMHAKAVASATAFRIIVLSLFAGSMIVLLVAAAPRHGPWFDEFWTRFLSDPSIEFGEAFQKRWVADVHPPLFSMMAWLSAQVVRLPIEKARLLNLTPLAILALYLFLVGKALPRARAFITVFAISVGSSAFFIEYFTEFRSYFTGLCAFAALTVTLIAQDQSAEEEKPGAQTLLWTGYLVSLLVCLNLHYLTTAVTVVLVGIFGCSAALRGNWRFFGIYLASGILAVLPFVAFVAYQWTVIERITADYWLKTSLPAALNMLIAAIAAPTYSEQLAVAIAWLAAAFIFLSRKDNPQVGRTIPVLLVAIIAEILMLLVYTWLTAAMTQRYLIPLAILSAALFALILARPIYENRWLLALFLVTNLGSAAFAALPRWNDPRWDEAARYLSERQKSCLGSRIIPMQQNPNDHTPNSIDNYNEAYAYIANKWGLTLGSVDTPSSRPLDASCPDFYWADHFFAAGKNRDTLLAQFSTRWPGLQGCTVTVKAFTSKSAVFEVTGEASVCGR